MTTFQDIQPLVIDVTLSNKKQELVGKKINYFLQGLLKLGYSTCEIKSIIEKNLREEVR